MNTIRTRKLKATDTVGARVRATGYGTSVTVPWDYGLNSEAMHAYAARRLAQKAVESYSAPEVQRVGTFHDGYSFEVTG